MLELKRTDGSLIARTRHKSVRRQVEAHKADLQGANLYGADLRRACLQGANLYGADLRRAYLQGANLYGADLTGADLHGANLHGADLRWAYLCWAYLQGANLYGAYLTGADLHGANLREAYLRWAYLQGAYLQGANLHGADLHGANLHGANLREANLCRANLYGADLRRADLQGSLSAEWLSKWRGADLLPSFEDGGVLVWKHVRLDAKCIIGNLCAEYAIGEPYEYASMVCAGPWGAVREVSDHRQAAHWAETARNPAPHLMAIHAASGALYDYAPDKGVYYNFRGTPVALYRVTNVDSDGFTPHLVAGEDVFGMIEGMIEGEEG